MIGSMKYLTVEYICADCRFAVKVKTGLTDDRAHHALNYRQAVGPETCFRCKQRKQTKNCICSSCNK